jgi:hypothetical protein
MPWACPVLEDKPTIHAESAFIVATKTYHNRRREDGARY